MNKIQAEVPLSPYTSWLVGGHADYFCLPDTIEELKEAQAWAQAQGHPIAVIGGGSNVLVSDEGVPGLTICLKNFYGTEIKKDDENFRITAMSGTSKSELLKIYLKNKLPPALFLAGLPGDVGGGVVMNAGVAEAFQPREFVEITEWIEVLRPDGKLQRLEAKDLQWSYRHCEGWQPGIITQVGLRCANKTDISILDKVKAANKMRLSKQPLDKPSCGSVFKNPTGHKAAQLIDSCGLKGFAIGGAEVSLKHANFIVNNGGALAQDIWHIMDYVQTTVKKETGIQLTTEVVRLGRW